MKELFKKYKNIILIIVIAVVLFFLYQIFLAGDDDLSDTSLLIAQPAVDDIQNAAIGREFLSVLLKLRSLDLDETIFSDRSFVILKDFSQEIKPQPSGRANPFLQIGNDPILLNFSGIGDNISTTTSTSTSTPGGGDDI